MRRYEDDYANFGFYPYGYFFREFVGEDEANYP